MSKQFDCSDAVFAVGVRIIKLKLKDSAWFHMASLLGNVNRFWCVDVMWVFGFWVFWLDYEIKWRREADNTFELFPYVSSM